MTSLVTDLLVNPVLRQARRFSFSRSSVASDPLEAESRARVVRTFPYPPQDDAISETDDSSLHGDSGESASSRPCSHGSELADAHVDVDRVREYPRQRDDTATATATFPTTTAISTVDACGPNSQGDSSAADESDTMRTPEPPSSPALQSSVPDHSPLPEDDGMGLLRKRILNIQGQNISHSEKAHLMHRLLMEGYTNSRSHVHPKPALSSSSQRSSEKRVSQGHGPLESFKFWQEALDEAENEERFILTAKELEPTFVPKKRPTRSTTNSEGAESDDERLLGCEHYRRNVKLQCSTCHRWYTCRFCHDMVEDHSLIRKETRNMLCMFCGTAQRASQACVSCEAPAARYYCDICKLWNDDPDKPCYHCNDCGICRIGHGIGKDFYHCKKCCACIAISTQSDHKCIERAIDCDCPICGEYMFTSPRPVCFMRCGHSIHRSCLFEHQNTSYKCPICNKSLLNMESQFRNLDLSIEAQPMPPEFRDTRVIVLCHDCSAKSSTMYHWLGLKCSVCLSYNTAQLQIIGPGAEITEPDVVVEHGAQASGLAYPEETDVAGVGTFVVNRRRRHSSIATEPELGGFDFSSLPPDRLARSVSPNTTVGRSLHASMIRGYFDVEEEEDDGPLFDFWSRIPRSLTSNNGDNDEDEDEAGGYSDDLSSDEDAGEDDGEESEDDDFELLGHR
ncbi:hypothetical protein F4777DRAFT_581189 [Nemania sp. FL0916]|nr:hypothetical protein F4777DRAFT_581189 [Nemania sp. FL0916]